MPAAEEDRTPETPGALRLGWMLLMQPLQLERLLAAHGLADDPSLLHALRERGALRARRDGAWSLLVGLLALLLVGMPALAFDVAIVVARLAAAMGLAVQRIGVVFGVAGGLLGGALIAAGMSLVRGVAVCFVAGAYGGVLGACLPTQMPRAVALGVAFATSVVALVRLPSRLYFALGVAVIGWALWLGGKSLHLSPALLLAGMLAALAGTLWTYGFSRAPIYAIEAVWTALAALAARLAPRSAVHLASWLPFRWHELIYFPLPGLRRFLVDLAGQDAALSLSLIDAAGATIGQQAAARGALLELRARSLERAARERLWANAAALELPFMSRSAARASSPFARFQRAAQELDAARAVHDHRRRRKVIERGRALLMDRAPEPPGDDLARRLEGTVAVWLRAVDRELDLLAEEERVYPQLPSPFEPGSPLRAADSAHLFRGRIEVVQRIDRELAEPSRALLFLTGLRRIGRTSLLYRLAERLGPGAAVIVLDLHELARSPHRGEPHRWLAAALAAARPELPAPPEGAAWAPTLVWLREAEVMLGGGRVLIAIDGIERLQEGIEEGWTTPAFLDFLCAASDGFREVRLLLASALPLRRLGRAWAERLVGVVTLELGYLPGEQVEDLIRSPISAFPDIYPPGGVARIARETRGHPYLIQMVCDALVREMNERRRLVADELDLERALARVIEKAPLFRELWDDRTNEERELLQLLARSEGLPHTGDRALRGLLEERLVEEEGGRCSIAVPLLRAWIRRFG